VGPSKALQMLKQRVSRAPRKKGKSNTKQLKLFGDEESPAFWQRRFYDFNVWSERKRREKVLYMHRNPVQRKLVQHPKDWPWSSGSFYAHGEGMIAIDVRGATQQQRKPAPLSPKGAAPDAALAP
jgi:hypothetical protein